MISTNDGANNANVIPASQRPDGSWRKPRRVKEGYVPQEEVPLYESKGKQFVNRSRGHTAASGSPQQVVLSASGVPLVPHATIPGLFLEQSSVAATATATATANTTCKKKKTKNQSTKSVDAGALDTIAVENVQKSLADTHINSADKPIDPVKRLKNLRKRLREIEALEQKIDAGHIHNPDKDQLEKVTRKPQILREIQILEM